MTEGVEDNRAWEWVDYAHSSASVDGMEPKQPIDDMETENFMHLWDDSESDTDEIYTDEFLAEFDRERDNAMEYDKRQACKL